VPKNGSLFFTIFQTFMSGPPKDGKPSPNFGEYPPDFFDFIVIDECHRGGANDESTWRDILTYFAPAVQLGLTATPKRKDKGFGSDQLAEMQKIIDAEKSDLFDVLAYVAYALPTISREARATNAKGAISTHFNSKQQAFLEFVLSQYVKVGVRELDKEKLSPLLKLKYNNAIADAVADLGKPEEIGKLFAGFQKYLYIPAA
jgi:superfamily II DNA or RNA helicase